MASSIGVSFYVSKYHGRSSYDADGPGDMAMDGPNFSHLLLLVMYLSGLRFSPNISQEERDTKCARYMSIANSLITEELGKPSSIVTARECLPRMYLVRPADRLQRLYWL